jgi:hypothetical protein
VEWTEQSQAFPARRPLLALPIRPPQPAGNDQLRRNLRPRHRLGTEQDIQFDAIAKGDGMSQTILVVEIRNSDIHWMEPRDIHINDLKPEFNAKNGPSLGSYHIEGAMIALADGSVHILSPEEIATKLPAMLTIADDDDSTPDRPAPE